MRRSVPCPVRQTNEPRDQSDIFNRALVPSIDLLFSFVIFHFFSKYRENLDVRSFPRIAIIIDAWRDNKRDTLGSYEPRSNRNTGTILFVKRKRKRRKG